MHLQGIGSIRMPKATMEERMNGLKIILLVLFLTKVESISLSWTPVKLIKPYETVKTLDERGMLTRTLLLPRTPANDENRRVDEDFDYSNDDGKYRLTNLETIEKMYRERSDRNLAESVDLENERELQLKKDFNSYSYDDLDFDNSDMVTSYAVDSGSSATEYPHENITIINDSDKCHENISDSSNIDTRTNLKSNIGDNINGVGTYDRTSPLQPTEDNNGMTTAEDEKQVDLTQDLEETISRQQEIETDINQLHVIEPENATGAAPSVNRVAVNTPENVPAEFPTHKQEEITGRENSAHIKQVEILEEKDAQNGDVQTFSVKFENGTVWKFRRMRRKKPIEMKSAKVAALPLPPPQRIHTIPPTRSAQQSLPPPRRPLDNGVFDAGKAHIKNKLAKFLNLFTVIQFSNDACLTADGLKGTCYHHLECRSQGGVPSGPCAQGYGTCCIFQNTCGETTVQNCTYFVDPGVTSNVKECSIDIVKSHPDVTQLRLDFAQFELVGPSNGSCIEDQFIVSGQNRNSIIPAICGINTGQHMYIDVTTTVSPVRLSVVTQMRNLDRHYRIKVTQVLRGSPLEAPRNCLQYYLGPTGTIESFNYQPQVVNRIVTPAGYMNNLNYAICIRKEDGYCSITFNNAEPFQLSNVDENGVSLISPRQAGVEIFDCPDDYIVLNGLRMCGEKLNDASGDVDYTRDAPVTETTNGPFIISVRTNGAYNGRGFRISYAQSPCT